MYIVDYNEAVGGLAIENVEETSFIFFPDKLPSQRQLSYQLCDIQDQEAQDLIHNNDGKEAVCTVSKIVEKHRT